MSSRHEEIADSLIHDILSGQYRHGERLPSERDLAARFDANRGAVREAMKKLEQLGLASIQPGGARVMPLQEASLDVVGPLLSLGDLPDPDLVDQIFQVVGSLITLSAELTVAHASDDQIAAIRARLQPMIQGSLSRHEYAEARYELMRTIMEASGNLVCRMITRALIVQLAPRLAPLEDKVMPDHASHRALAVDLDDALRHRDAAAVRATFQAMSALNRESVRRGFAAVATNGSPSRGNGTLSNDPTGAGGVPTR